MQEHQVLLIPGPTPVPPAILREHARTMINHRGPEFAAMQAEIDDGLKKTFKTKNHVYTLTCSGTGAMEAAVVNVLSPGEKVLALVIGAFGDRFAKIAQAYGADVERMEFEWGAAVDVDQLAARLKKDTGREIKAVLVQQNETSTGVTNDMAGIGRVVHEHGALLIVDAVSGLVAIDLETDKWHLDVVAAASQKAFMLPPGLGFVSLSERAWKAYETSTMPKFYFDLGQCREFAEKGQTPFTPALPQYYGLHLSLKLLEREGLDNVFKRHARLGRAVRSAAQAMGLDLLVKDERVASNAVTAILSPKGVNPSDLRKNLLKKYDVVLAGGQGKLKDDIFRIGHLGYVTETDILSALTCLGMGLHDFGVKADISAAIAAAQTALA